MYIEDRARLHDVEEKQPDIVFLKPPVGAEELKFMVAHGYHYVQVGLFVRWEKQVDIDADGWVTVEHDDCVWHVRHVKQGEALDKVMKGKEKHTGIVFGNVDLSPWGWSDKNGVIWSHIQSRL